jgi:hypothetical protein
MIFSKAEIINVTVLISSYLVTCRLIKLKVLCNLFNSIFLIKKSITKANERGKIFAIYELEERKVEVGRE